MRACAWLKPPNSIAFYNFTGRKEHGVPIKSFDATPGSKAEVTPQGELVPQSVMLSITTTSLEGNGGRSEPGLVTIRHSLRRRGSKVVSQ